MLRKRGERRREMLDKPKCSVKRRKSSVSRETSTGVIELGALRKGRVPRLVRVAVLATPCSKSQRFAHVAAPHKLSGDLMLGYVWLL
jgi:hypothetical protein